MNKRAKTIIKVIIIMILLLNISIPIYASSNNLVSIADRILGTNATPFKIFPDTIVKWIAIIFQVCRNVVIVATVIVLSIMGIKYMFGSVEDRRVQKAMMVNVVIGAIFVGSLFHILSFIMEFFNF